MWSTVYDKLCADLSLKRSPPPFASNQYIFSRPFSKHARSNQRQRFLFFLWFQFSTSLVIDDEFTHLISLRFQSSLLWDPPMLSPAQVFTSPALASTHDILCPFLAAATNVTSPVANCYSYPNSLSLLFYILQAKALYLSPLWLPLNIFPSSPLFSRSFARRIFKKSPFAALFPYSSIIIAVSPSLSFFRY